VSKRLRDSLVVLVIVATSLIAVGWFLEHNILRGCFGGCGRDGCGLCSSVSNAPAS